MARHTVPPPTKEFFIPCTKGTEAYNVGYHTGYRLDAVNEHAYVEFKVPRDFHSIISATVVWISLAAISSLRLDTYTDFGARGEAYNTHSDSALVTVTYAANLINETNIVSALDALAAGDYVGCDITTVSASPNYLILGVKLIYT